MGAERTVLRLSNQVGGDHIRGAVLVGEDEQLGGARFCVGAHPALHEPFGKRHVDVAGTHDLLDRPDRLGAVSERRYRLSAAHPVDLRDACDRARSQNRLGDLTAGSRRRAHGYGSDPRYRSGHRRHHDA